MLLLIWMWVTPVQLVQKYINFTFRRVRYEKSAYGGPSSLSFSHQYRTEEWVGAHQTTFSRGNFYEGHPMIIIDLQMSFEGF